MYELYLIPEQVKGIDKVRLDVITVYADVENCSGLPVDMNSLRLLVVGDAANFVQLRLDTRVAIIYGRMKKVCSDVLACASFGDVLVFPCGCAIRVLDKATADMLFDPNAEPWGVEYASVHAVDER